MAARFDRKFIVILAACTAIAAVVIGIALAVLQPWGPARHLRRAEAAAASGDWVLAWTFYGRAFGKEPGNIAYLDLTRDALLRIVPQTATEAMERYQTLLALLDRATRVGSPSPERWQEFLDAIADRAVCLDEGGGWIFLAEQADLMTDAFAPGDPARATAEEFAAFSTAQRDASLRSDEREALIESLEALVDTMPSSDRIRGSLIQIRLAEAIRLVENGRRLEAAESFAEVDDLLEEADAAGVDGVEMRIAKLRLAGHRLAAGQGSETEVDAALEALADAASKATSADRLRIARAIILSGRPAAGPKAGEILGSHVAENPDDLFHAQLLAFVLKFTDQDRASEVLRSLIDRPQLATGLESAFQSQIALNSAVQLFDLGFAAWSQADDDATRSEAVERLAKELQTIATLTSGSADDSLRVRCEAKFELARGNDSAAATKFEQVLRGGKIRDLDTLYYAALALRQIGESGRALQLLEEAQAMQPDNLTLLGLRAETSIRVGRNREALEIGRRMLALDPNNEGAQRLLETASRLEGLAVGSADDPATQLLKQAETAFSAARYDEAESILASMRSRFPDDSRVPRAQAQVALRQQKTIEAERFVVEALEMDPRDPILLRMQAVLSTDDPIQRIALVTEQTHAGDPGLPGYLFAAYEAARREFQRQSETLIQSDPDAAKRFSDLAIRAAEAAQQARAGMDSVEDVPAVIAARFDEAVAGKDFAAAVAIAAEADATGDPALRPLLESRARIAQGDLPGALAILDRAIAAGISASRVHRERGVILEAIGRPGDAIDAYAETLSRRPNDLDAIRRRAALLARSGRNSEALELLRDARRLAPQDRGLEESWLGLEGEFGDARSALARRRERFAIDPKDQLNAIGLARLLVVVTPGREDVVDRQGRVRFGTGQWASLSATERQTELEAITTSMRQQGLTIFASLLEQRPDDLDLVRTYANSLRKLGRAIEGEQALRAYIDRRGDEAGSQAWLSLGAYLVEILKGPEALEAFERALAVQDPQTKDADLALSDFWFRRGDWERALRHLDQVASSRSGREVSLRRAECLMKLGRFDDASQVLAGISDRDLTSILLEAAIADNRGLTLLESGDGAAAEAYQRFEALAAEARERAPASPLPLVQLAGSVRGRARVTGDPAMADAAISYIDEALRLDPSNWPAARMRADLLAEQGNLSGSAAGLEEFLGRNPDLADARRRLVEAQIASDNLDRAIEVLAEAIERSPNDANWHQNFAEIALRRRQFPEALASFRRAYELAPNPATLHRVVDMQLRQRPPDFEGILELIAMAPEDVEKSVYLQSAEAAALHGTGRTEQARERLAGSYRFAKSAIADGRATIGILDGWYANLRFVYGPPEAATAEQFVRGVSGGALHPIELRWLAELNAASGESGFVRAASLLDEAVSLDDGSDGAVSARLMLDLGNLRYSTGDCLGAVEAFEKSIALGRPNPQTLNNLAFLCGDCLDQPARGLPYIEQAISISGSVPEYFDTYGYLLWKAGRLPEAEETLLRSLRLKQTALANYHLAEVLAARGNVAQARTAIQRARNLEPDGSLSGRIDELETRLR
jgi:tetratricopeptide (TPR) repeat protein